MKKVFLLLSLLSGHVLANDNDWYTPPADNLVYLQLEQGPVIIELAPFAAPNHVKQFKNLVDSGFYDGLDFYRVIDGFVAQAGDVSETRTSDFNQPLKAEVAVVSDTNLLQVEQKPAFFADETGYWQGFPAARDQQSNEHWLTHCPGTVAMARSTELNSGASDFYVVIGQAPRHLDRNMSVFGRVIWGMPLLQALPRGELANGGVIDDPAKRGKIISAKLGNKLADTDKLLIEVERSNGESVQNRLQSARTRDNPFFYYKGEGKLDICYYPPRTRLRSQATE